MAIWDPDKRSSWEPWIFQNMTSSLPFSRMTYQNADWFWCPKFWGRTIFWCAKSFLYFCFNNFSLKNTLHHHLFHFFDIMDWCMSEWKTQKWMKQVIYPIDPPWPSLFNWIFLRWEHGKKRWEDYNSEILKSGEPMKYPGKTCDNYPYC